MPSTQSPFLYSPYAPPAVQGVAAPIIGQMGGAQYQPQAFDYILDVTLTANQTQNTFKSIDTDADFVWTAVQVNLNTGAFKVQFTDTRLYQLSSDQIHSANLIGSPAAPYALGAKGIKIDAGGRIGVFITDLSGAPNTIQFAFRGYKLIRVA